MPQHWQRGEYFISTDKALLQSDIIHSFLANESYWAKNIPLETVTRSIQHSECFGIYRGSEQVGFARAITDYATFAWIADVFVLPAHRGQGLAHWLMECIIAHPDLQGLRRMVLATRDAHEIYKASGFLPLPNPDRWMFLQGKGY